MGTRCIRAVSYTHLDVYKRQAYNNNVAAVFSEEDNVTLSFGEEALRVYKVCLLYTSRMTKWNWI